MAKGKFSQSRHGHSADNRSGRFSRDPETEPLFRPEAEGAGDPLSCEPDQNTQEVDFRGFEDLNIEDLTESLFDAQTDDPENGSSLQEGFGPIPPRYIPTEEEAIEQSFQQAMASGSRARSSSGAAMKNFWSKHRLVLLITLAVIVTVSAVIGGGLSLYRYFTDPYDHLILSNVTVAGVNVGGMNRSQAEKAVSAGVEPVLYGKNMVIALPGQSITLTPKDSGVSLDVGGAVKEAYRFGRTGSQQQKEEDYRYSLTQTHTVELSGFVRVDESSVRGILESYGASHDSTFIQSSYALEGEQPPLDFDHFNENNTTQTLLLSPGTPGFHMDTERIYQEILSAYARLDLNPRLELPMGDQTPDPLDLGKIHREYTIEPVDSSLDEDTMEVISGSYGYTFDLEEAATKLDKAAYGETVRIPMIYMEPDTLDHEVFFQDVLSHAETPHGKNANRTENLRLACKAIDGVILEPGDEFSYNETLGQRTADKGYKPAPAYSGDVLVDSLGGGICQVSSTLYWSTMKADLEITDRINHGFPPTYMPIGLDATVSWGGPDFKFRNNSEYPVQIHAETTDELVIVEIWGTDDRDYYVEIEYEASYSDPQTVYQEYSADSGYYDGQILQSGITKHYAKTYRCKYSKETNELLSREVEARSSYMGRDTVIAVVKSAEAPAPAPEETQPPVTPDPTVKPEPTEPAPGPEPSDPPAPDPTDPPPDPEPEPEPQPEEGGDPAVPEEGGETA